MRDDFSKQTKEILAKRVGYRCSNPNCRKITCGPQQNTEGVVNIGVASHITAASKGGPRFDEHLTSEERSAYDNGIWLCQSCSKLIDSDVKKYTIKLLNIWKENAEKITMAELEVNSSNNIEENDKRLIQFYAQCFQRPAFEDDIRIEGCMEDFDKAIEDTLIAINTGILKDRNGEIIKEVGGRYLIRNEKWYDYLDEICSMLTALRKRLKIAENNKQYKKSNEWYYFIDESLYEWFNYTRADILKTFSAICREAGVRELKFKNRSRYW